MALTHAEAVMQGPMHGFRGDDAVKAADRWPCGLTIALTRESGARGGSIGKRVGRILGWQVVDQDLLEFLTQDEHAFEEVSAGAREWAGERLDQLLRSRIIKNDRGVIALARTVLLLGAQGEVVLIGRGAGFILPPATTLHARIIAPEADRVAYMSQWMRLTIDEAEKEVRRRDRRRSDFLTTQFGGSIDDLYPYDFVLNSSRLGEVATAELIAQAARGKLLELESLGAEAASGPSDACE